MIKISERLKAAAALVGSGNVLADVGTDHGYVPIYLVEQKRIPRAIAMDINRGPLERAREHIALYGMGAYIQTRISDGVAALAPREADSILIAGMGGGLVLHILSEGALVCREAKELILQPQSELARVREYLEECGYVTDMEDIIKEDGKYYPMMRVHFANKDMQKKCSMPEDTKQSTGCNVQAQVTDRQVKLRYGSILLQQQHPVLKEYLEKEWHIYTGIENNLKQQQETEQIGQRICEVKEVLAANRAALAYYG